MRLSLITYILLLLVNALPSSVKGVDYYVDMRKGSDSNPGTSTGMPWKTLTKLNAISFKPGDRIFLKRGQSFKGSLLLTGSGSPGHPVILGAYGTGKRPVILSSGHDFGIRLLDVEYWEMNDIETWEARGRVFLLAAQRTTNS